MRAATVKTAGIAATQVIVATAVGTTLQIVVTDIVRTVVQVRKEGYVASPRQVVSCVGMALDHVQIRRATNARRAQTPYSNHAAIAKVQKPKQWTAAMRTISVSLHDRTQHEEVCSKWLAEPILLQVHLSLPSGHTVPLNNMWLAR